MKTFQEYLGDLTHEREAVRLHAVRQLRFFDNDEAIELLQGVFARDTFQVKAEALFSVFFLQPAAAQEMIAQSLESQSEYLNIAALHCLNQRPFEEFAVQLLKMFRRKKGQLRLLVAGALALYPENQDVRKTLLDALQDQSDPAVLIAVSRSCAESYQAPAMPLILKSYLTTDNEKLRDLLLDCILTLGSMDSRYFFIELGKLHKIFVNLAEDNVGGYFGLQPMVHLAEKLANSFRKEKYHSFTEELFAYSFNLVSLQGKHTGGWDIMETSIEDFNELQSLLPLNIWLSLEVLQALVDYGEKLSGNTKAFQKQLLQLATAAFYRIVEEMRMVQAGKPDALQDDLDRLANATSIEPRLVMQRLASEPQSSEQVLEIINRRSNVFSMMYGSLILGKHKNKEALPMLVELLKACNDMVAQYIIKSLTEFDFEDIFQPLVSLLHEDSSNWTRVYVCGTLIRWRQPQCLELLLEQLHSEEIQIQINIIRDLEEFGDPGAIEPLRSLLQAGQVELVQTAKAALLTLCQGNDIVIPELANIIEEFKD